VNSQQTWQRQERRVLQGRQTQGELRTPEEAKTRNQEKRKKYVEFVTMISLQCDAKSDAEEKSS